MACLLPHACSPFRQLRASGGRVDSGAGPGTGAGQGAAPGGFEDPECQHRVSRWTTLLNAIVVPEQLQSLFVDHPLVCTCTVHNDVLVVAETHCVKRLLDTIDKSDRAAVTAEVRPSLTKQRASHGSEVLDTPHC